MDFCGPPITGMTISLGNLVRENIPIVLIQNLFSRGFLDCFCRLNLYLFNKFSALIMNLMEIGNWVNFEQPVEMVFGKGKTFLALILPNGLGRE
jgi:hypothetical protein